MPWPVRLSHMWSSGECSCHSSKSQLLFVDTVLLWSTAEGEPRVSHVLDKYSAAQLSFLSTFTCSPHCPAVHCPSRVRDAESPAAIVCLTSGSALSYTFPFLTFYLSFMNVDLLPECVSVHCAHAVPWRPAEGIRFPWDCSYEQLCPVAWVLLVAEPSL